jgi:hypothetical protein
LTASPAMAAAIATRNRIVERITTPLSLMRSRCRDLCSLILNIAARSVVADPQVAFGREPTRVISRLNHQAAEFHFSPRCPVDVCAKAVSFAHELGSDLSPDIGTP